MDKHLSNATAPLSSARPGGELENGQRLLKEIEQLLTAPARDLKTTLLQEMLRSVVKLSDPNVDLLDVKILHRAIKELRYAFKMFRPYHHVPKVSIYGSARISPDDPNFQLAYRFGRLLSARGFMVITGAGPGIMWAAHEGAGKEQSFGINIMLPFEQAPNALIAEDKKLVNLKYFFSRKLLFVKESHATGLFPGGFGTLDEGFEVLTLIQTGKTNPAPVVCLAAPGCDYWERWSEFLADQLLSRGLISTSDFALFKIVHDEYSAVQEIETFYRRYHSIRYVGPLLVMRLRQPLTPDELACVNREFRDLLTEGQFESSSALAEERDEPDLARLPRLVFRYNRKDAGRLRQLIDWINVRPDR
ncbi:MAG: LOG family protein [Nitrospirae bacterium]|nr:MAG: LOG family protein [Nitrospirota bacterium]